MRFFLPCTLGVFCLQNCVGSSCKNDQAKVVLTSILQLMDNLEKTDKCPTITSVSCDKCNTDPIIAFSAILTKSTKLNHNDVIVYDKVRTNLGSNYNSKTGFFNAPVKGVYHFTATIMSTHNQALHVMMYKNSVEIGYGHGAKGEAVMGSITSVIELEKGDTVTVREALGGQIIYGDRFCSFSGYLIRQI